jgi:hypothetical protein
MSPPVSLRPVAIGAVLAAVPATLALTEAEGVAVYARLAAQAGRRVCRRLRRQAHPAGGQSV